MAENRPISSLGERLRSIRRSRGIKSTRELSLLINSPNVTPSILQNVESGRRTELTMSQVLNIAFALSVPPSFLLAPLRTPDAQMDLPNLSAALASMSARQFDSWLSGVGAYVPVDLADREDRHAVQALRELDVLRAELRRLQVVATIEDDSPTSARTSERLSRIQSEIAGLEAFLGRLGFSL